MRKVLIFVFYLLFGIFSSFGQTSETETTKVKMEIKTLYSFYNEYFKLFNQIPSSTNLKKLKMLQKKYCTISFYKKIPLLIEQQGADVFLKAQDSDIDYFKSLKIEKDLKSSEYLVTYFSNGLINERITISIHVQLIKQGNQYKINSVR